MRQLTFPFAATPSFARKDFIVGPCNRRAYDLLETWPSEEGGALIVCGPQGCGKSHLGALWKERHSAHTFSSLDTVSFEGAVLVDGADQLEDEESLLHLYNLCQESKCPLLLLGRVAPRLWPYTLKDLVSRLRSVPICTIEQPDDDVLLSLMKKLMADRQLAVKENVLSYLLARIERSYEAVRDLVSTIDLLSLEGHRAVTIALVRYALEISQKVGPV